jgi:hypothetical protein
MKYDFNQHVAYDIVDLAVKIISEDRFDDIKEKLLAMGMDSEEESIALGILEAMREKD